MNKIMLAVLLPALFLGCSKNNQNGFLNNENAAFSDLFTARNLATITVLSTSNQPLAHAQVLIGEALNKPFAGNFLTTDNNGQLTLPAQWADAEAVTVAAPGYVRTTYLDQKPGALTFHLRPLPRITQYEVSGTAQNLPIVNYDGNIDFALALPGLSRQDMMIFDLDTIISSQNDTVSVLGFDLDIPSNFSVPEQTERYMFLSATFNKPQFHLYYGQPGANRVYALRGRFELKTVVDDLRHGSKFLDVVNSFAVTGGSMKDINVAALSIQQNLPMKDLNYTGRQTVVAPHLAADESFLVLSAFQQNGLMMPSDVKRLTAGESMALATLPQSPSYVLGVVKKSADFNHTDNVRMSTVLLPFTNGIHPQTLPLIEAPSISGNNLFFPTVTTIPGVNEIGTYARLTYDVKTIRGANDIGVFTPYWEVYASGWVNQASLPEWPQEPAFSGSKRWEVSFIGSQTSSQSAIGPAMMEAATHVTHNSVSF